MVNSPAVSDYRSAFRRRVGTCHVGDSILRVVRWCLRLHIRDWRAFCRCSRAERRAILAAIVTEHRHNQDIYRYVMTGRR